MKRPLRDIRDLSLKSIQDRAPVAGSMEKYYSSKDYAQNERYYEEKKKQDEIYAKYEKQLKIIETAKDLKAKNEALYLANTTGIGRFLSGMFGNDSGLGRDAGASNNLRRDKDGKLYQKEDEGFWSFGEGEEKEVKTSEINRRLNEEGMKISSSNSYSAGKNIKNLVNTGLNEFTKGTIGLIPSLAKIVGYTAQKVVDMPLQLFRNEKDKESFIKQDKKRKAEILLGLETSLSHLMPDSSTLASLYNLPLAYTKKFLEDDINQRTEDLTKIYADERKNGKIEKTNATKMLDLVFDNIVDPFEKHVTETLTGKAEENDLYKELNNIAMNRAMANEGRTKKEMFDTSGMAPLSTKKVRADKQVFNPINGRMEFVNAGEFDEELLPEGATDLLDTKIISKDEQGNVKFDEQGNPRYVNKYTLGDKLGKSDLLGYVTDKYNMTEMTDLAGNAASFIGIGKVAGSITGRVTSAVAKVTANTAARVSQSLSLAAKTEALIAKLSPTMQKGLSIANKGLASKPAQVIARPFSQQGINTMLNSYLLTNTESEQIGDDTYKNTYNTLIDKASGVNDKEISDTVRAYHPNISEEELELKVLEQKHAKRIDFEENPENVALVEQAAIAATQAKGFAVSTNNTLGFLTNLTSASLFTKAPSFSRNLLKNPLSAKNILLGTGRLGLEGVQEGIEEGYINAVSQKAGESFGKTGKFSFDDYIENDLFSTENIQQGMLGMFMGVVQTGGTNATNLKSDRKKFKEQQEQIKELTDIGALPIDQLKKLVNSSYNLDEAQAYSEEIQRLTAEGKTEEVKALQDKLLINQSVRAAVSGTSSVLTDTLTSMLQNDQFNEKEKANIQKSIKFNEMIADMHDKHINHKAKNRILQNRGNKFMIGEAITEFQNTDLVEAQKNYNDAVDRTVRQNLQNARAGMSESQLEEMTNNYSDIFENTKSAFTPNRLAMAEYDILLKTKEGIRELEDNQDSLDEQYKELISEPFQSKYSLQVAKERVKKIIDSVTRKNAKETKEEAQKEEVEENEESTIANEIDNKVYEQEAETPIIPAETSITPTQVVKEEEEEEEEEDVEEIPLSEEESNLWVNMVNNENQSSLSEELEPEEDSPFNAPMPLSPSEKGKRVLQSAKELFSEGGTFKGAIGAIMNTDPTFADEYYNYIAEGYNQAHPDSPIGKDELDRIYKQIFPSESKTKKFLSDVRSEGIEPSNKSTGSVSEVPVTGEVEMVVEQSTNSNESVIIDIETKQPTTTYKGYKTVKPDVKLSFLGQDIEISEDGTSYSNATNEVNPEAFPALHFENFKPGDKVKLTFNWDFFNNQTTITTYQQNEDGSVDTTPKSIKQFVEDIFGKGYYETFLQKIKTKEGRVELLQNEEFLGYIPTSTILPNGENTGLGINSINWWNTKNVALEQNAKGEYLVERQRQLINEARVRNIRLRQAIASGSEVELTVESKTEGFHNKLLLENEEEQEQGYSNKFQSIIDAFGGNQNGAIITIGLGAINGDAPVSFKRNGELIVKIGNKEVFLTSDNSNIVEFKNSMNISSGNYNGKPFMAYQTGYNVKGEPQYAIRAVVSNHAEMSDKHAIQFEILQRIKYLGNVANGSIRANSTYDTEKAQKMFDFFKRNYNINIADWKELSNKLEEYYPKKLEIPKDKQAEFGGRKYYKVGEQIDVPVSKKNPLGKSIIKNAFKQDYKISNKDNPNLPDLTGFTSIAEFEKAVFGDGVIPNTTANQIFMQNTHTQYVFSEITSKQHEPVWTTEVQSKITFADEFTQAQREEDKAQEIKNLQAQLEGNQKIQEEIDQRLSETEDKLEIRRLEKEKVRLEQERVQAENELVSEGLQPKESTKVEPQPNSVQSKVDEINKRREEELNKIQKNYLDFKINDKISASVEVNSITIPGQDERTEFKDFNNFTIRSIVLKADKTDAIIRLTDGNELLEFYVDELIGGIKNKINAKYDAEIKALGSVSTNPSQIDEIERRRPEIVDRYSNADVKANPDTIYVFGDNTQRTGTGGQAQIRNNPNAFGIATKLKPTNNVDAFMSDADLEANKKVIDSDIRKILNQNKKIVFPKDGFGTGLAKLKEKAPKTYEYLKQRLLEEFGFNNDTGEINVNPTPNQKVEKETIRKYDENDINTINQSLMYNALKNIKSKDFTRQDLLESIIKEYYSMIDSLSNKGMEREADFLKENRAQILGEEEYDGSVMEMIDTLFDLNPDEALDFSSEFIKDQNKDTSEVDITASLSLRVKMLLSGIQDSRNTATDSFARLPEYFTFKDTMDFLQQGLSEIHNNNLEDFEKWVRDRVAKNPREFIFYNQILKRLKDLKQNDEAFLNEIMYFLHQPKVEMTFMMYSMMDNGTFTVQKYDANAKSPAIAKRRKWQQNLKTSSLLDFYEGSFYTVNPEALAEVDKLYKSIVASRESGKEINFADLTKYFSYFGIQLNQATLRGLNNNVLANNNYRLYHVEKKQQGSGILAKNQLFENLYENIQQANVHIGLGFKMTLDARTISSKLDKGFNPLTDNTTSSLKILIDADNAFSAINYNSMRIAGKSINPFQQSKSITNTVSRLKQDKEFLQKLKDTPITSNSFLVEMLEKNPAFLEYFSVRTMSLEAFKTRDSDSRDDMSPTDLSDLDAMVTLINLFGQNDGKIELDEFTNLDIKLRKGSITFPTLSDSSQQPIMNTVLLDLQQTNFDDLNIETLGDNVLGFITDKLVKNELKRVAAFLKSGQSTNIKGHDAGAQLINTLVSLNTVLIDTQIQEGTKTITVKRPLIEVFKKYQDKDGQKWLDKDVDAFIEEYQKDIYNEIREHLNHEVKTTLDNFKKEGIYTVSEVDGVDGEINKIDNKYLESKGTLINDNKIKLIAYDYVVNNLISLNEIQNIFAGDTANYFKDKMTEDFEFGMPKVTIQDLAQFYYPQLSAEEVEYYKENYKDPEVRKEIEENYPVLLSATEIALSEFEDRMSDINPVARLKMVDIYKDVQNNLSKRLKALVSPGNQYPNSMSEDQNYLQIMLQDVENSSEVLHSLAQRFHPDIYEKYKDKIDEFKRLDDIYPTNRNEPQIKKHKALKQELEIALHEIKGFLKNATTDAQEYSTWQDNLNQLRNQGRVTQEEYEKIFDKLQAQTDDVDKLGYITEANKWSKDEKDLRSKSVMQVSKPLYSGHHLEDSNGYKHSRYIYIKSSSFALTPELTVGFPKLNNMRKNLERLQVVDSKTRKITTTVRASYDSANKVGAVKQGLPISELYKEKADFNNALVNSNTVKLEKSNFYIQQDKPFKSDKNAKAGKRDKVTRATQFEKILLGDEINKITEAIFPNIFDSQLLEEFGIEAGDMLNGPQLKSIYDKLYEKEQKLLTEKFNEELGITNINDIANGKPEVLKKLVSKLKARLTNKQDLKSLELEYTVLVDSKSKRFTESELSVENLKRDVANEEFLVPIKAQFKIPLYMMPNSNKFESVLNAMINKSNVNLELPGYSAPVASQEGFDFKGYTGKGQLAELKKKGLVTTKNFDPSKGLQATRTEDGKLKYAQVFIANKYKVYDETTGQYDYINLENFVDENGQIDTAKLPEELLSMFSFRIPTSSHQSGVIIEVAGFLPHNSADLMIVPKDHTTQIGEDYDIDMRYVYQYNYFLDKTGKLKKMSTEDLSMDNAEAERLKAAYTSFRDTLVNTYFESQDGTSRVKNPVLSHNREAMLNIASLNSLLENWNDSVMIKQSLQEEWELEEGITKTDVIRKIQDYEFNIIPKFVSQEVKDKLKNEYKSLNKQLTEEYNNRRQTTLDYYRAKNQKMDQHKVIENNLVSLYKSVFSSNDDRVQKLINKTLSTDNAENTAKEMDRVLNSTNKSPYYSFHSASLQRDILKLGASGKTGIGEHSNAVTMNSLFQQSEMSHQIFKEKDEYGQIIPYNIILGNESFTGEMGKITVNGVRISEMAMEDQNSATDNQKLQIMGRRNEDKNTMSVLKILHASGIENDNISINGQTLSYASLFINQPILRRYSQLVNSLSSASNNSKGNSKDMAVRQLMKEFKELLPDHIWAENEFGKTVPGKLKTEIYQETASRLNSGELYNQLLEEQSNTLSQFVVLQNFLSLQSAASTYNEMQKLVNIERNGMGVSYFDAIKLMETLLDVVDGKVNITNSDKMIGEVEISSFKDEEKEANLRASGFVPVITKDSTKVINSNSYKRLKNGETVWIKPTNHYSHKIVNSIALGYTTYNSLFPYNHQNISNAINEIMKNLSIKNENTEQGKKQKYKIVSDLKDYIYTNNTTLFEGNVNKARKDLFFDDKSKGEESLATYLLKLSQNPEYISLFRRPFFRDLNYRIENINLPSIIEFNNSDISKINTLDIYNNFERMMNSKKRLPPFKGKQYSEQALMKDLLKYSLLADQGNGAIGFRQHLPIQLFERHGVIKGVSNITNTSSNYQSIAYNGAIKSVERLFGSTIQEDGTIQNNNSSLTNNQITSLVKSTNVALNKSFGIQDAVSYDYVNNTLNYSLHDGKIIKSSFVRQYIQHNIESVVGIESKKLTELLDSHSFNLEDITSGAVKEFYFKTQNKFVTIKDSVGRLHLYEQVANHFFEEIPTLGMFGMKEYSIKGEQTESQITKNNPIPTPTIKLAVDKSMIPSMLNASENGEVIGTNFESFLNKLSAEDYQGDYAPLFKLFRSFVNFSNVKIQVGKPGNYTAKYYTTGVIVINPSLLEEGNFNQSKIAKLVAEEMMHHITVNVLGRYITFTGFNPLTNTIAYDVVEDEDGNPIPTPAEVLRLISVYNAALQQMAKKHGTEAIVNKIKNAESHLGSNEGKENDLHRVSNIHEFIAGIFMKDENFAKEMANTPYKSSGMSIAEAFIDTLKKLFHRVIPSYKKETISGEVASALTQLLHDMTADKTNKPVKSQFKLIYDTPEKRQAFSKSLKLINELQEKQLTGAELLADDDSGDFFEPEDLDTGDNEGLNAPTNQNISTFAEEALKCK